MTLQVKVQKVNGTVDKEYKQSGQTITTESEVIPVGEVQTTPDIQAVVSIAMGMTKNLGNFEAFKVNVSLSIPCENELGAINNAADRAYN